LCGVSAVGDKCECTLCMLVGSGVKAGDFTAFDRLYLQIDLEIEVLPGRRGRVLAGHVVVGVPRRAVRRVRA